MPRSRALLLVLLGFVAILGVGASSAAYRGNTKSRVFHDSSCRYYRCPNCTVVFDSVEAAKDAGYRPCGTCRPGTAATTPADAGYSGNTRSRKFHRASCSHAGCANCTAKFKTRQEAIDAGYAPGGCCRP